MRTAVRLYLGWRLIRLLRPLLAAGVLAAVLLAFHGHSVQLNRPAASALQGGAAAVSPDLTRAFERGFAAPHR
jgi:hypothetical protein